MKQCPTCHQYNEDYAQFCSNCGQSFSGDNKFANNNNKQVPPPMYSETSGNNLFDCGPEGKSRGVAALLAIFLGGLGIQYFYLGKTGAGLITIGLTIITCGLWEIVTFIQGILMLCMTNDSFRQKYVTTNSTFPLF